VVVSHFSRTSTSIREFGIDTEGVFIADCNISARLADSSEQMVNCPRNDEL
jgi:hypothetical protein